jgi:hypothetical protein
VQVVVLLLCFTIAWSLAILLTSLSPPTDNIEQLNWVHRLDWGYYKHPPLPTWLLWLPTQLLGATAATSHAMGIGTNLVSLGLFWCLLERLRGARHATLALLAVLCITYYNNRLPVYNHNTVLMLVSTACAALTWKAMHSDRIRWWLALGLALGLGALTKYQIGVTATSVLAFWLAQRGWRNPARRACAGCRQLAGRSAAQPQPGQLGAADAVCACRHPMSRGPQASTGCGTAVAVVLGSRAPGLHADSRPGSRVPAAHALGHTVPAVRDPCRDGAAAPPVHLGPGSAAARTGLVHPAAGRAAAGQPAQLTQGAGRSSGPALAGL